VNVSISINESVKVRSTIFMSNFNINMDYLGVRMSIALIIKHSIMARIYADCVYIIASGVLHTGLLVIGEICLI
jgi:hypothetical protein